MKNRKATLKKYWNLKLFLVLPKLYKLFLVKPKFNELYIK